MTLDFCPGIFMYISRIDAVGLLVVLTWRVLTSEHIMMLKCYIHVPVLLCFPTAPCYMSGFNPTVPLAGVALST
jgi:hypothetical protein